MEFQSVKKVAAGKFIHRYDITYQTAEDEPKVYEMISRNPDIRTREELIGDKPDSVVLIMHNVLGDKILLNREFRLACGTWVYNFPAGLIDPGETAKEAAKRELWEETGLALISVSDVIPNSYSAIGFSNEINVCILGTADGEFRKSTSAAEEIEAGWFTKAQVRDLINNHPFAGRTQAYCYLWSRQQ